MPGVALRVAMKRNKNDATDAEAICEAVRRPTMRFVTVKMIVQQGRLMQHGVRDQLMRCARVWPSSGPRIEAMSSVDRGRLAFTRSKSGRSTFRDLASCVDRPRMHL